MLDYKSIIIKRYALHMTYQELADEFNASKSGINDFIHAFEKCENLSYPLPEGITNYAIRVRGLTPLRECYRCYEKNAGPEGPNSIWISPKDISSLLRELRESRDSLETDAAIVGITVGIVSKE